MNELSENRGVQVRFLLGPAGAGKTFRCLEEIRAELKRSPEGPPLIFLAPKQATFQLERQLLVDTSLHGFTRLHIVSFERLASLTLTALCTPAPRMLSDEGRVMVLRALLAQHCEQLQLFRASARLPGFAQQLSALLRELQRGQASPAAVAEAAAKLGSTPLARKLNDVAFIFGKYVEWLEREKIEDADRLLDLATNALESAAKNQGPSVRFGGLWLDGFAEMTEQELTLLRALLPWCAEATLAFCCEADAVSTHETFSPWSVVAHTARRCLNVVKSVEPQVTPMPLKRDARINRFSNSVELAHLEEHWASPIPFFSSSPGHEAHSEKSQIDQSLLTSAAAENGVVRVIRCAAPEEEATFAAREICRHVHSGGRYRDVAVIVREIESYQDILRRVFARYGIPCFLDRREPIAHHPLAELTRYAMRTLAFGWKQEDWFGLLKSGLTGIADLEVDWLENEALARGWEGKAWLEPIRIDEDATLAARLEASRQRAVGPVRAFQASLAGANGAGKPAGVELAAALRELWRAFRVSEQLNEWARESSASAVHATVWDQMEQWLQTVALGFAHQRVALREWLPIIEAGLGGLTVGVIPPALDQVLVGSIDRSRNPDLQIAFVLGVNEGVFPAPSPDPVLLTESDRAQLESALRLGPSARQQLAHERFYGYIACTRARQKLFVTFCDAERQGRKCNPSAFITHLQRLFPQLAIEHAGDLSAPQEILHASELMAPVLRASRADDPRAAEMLRLPAFDSIRDLATSAQPREGSKLSPEIVAKLYPQRLVTSVSRLEEFASCRFRFFVTVGLRAKERIRYEVDARHTGTFQHEVLKEFHETVRQRFQSWQKVEAAQARALIREIGERRLPDFKSGVLVATDRARIESENLITALEDFIETIVGWMQQYDFEPMAVELKFGDDGALPPWELGLDGGRKLAFTGSIDRVDLLIDPATRTAHVVVMDYKSSGRTVDAKLLAAGVQLQLFAYLSTLQKLPQAAALFGVERLAAAGAFYVSLRGYYESAGSRDEALADAKEARREAYKHRGRFIRELLPLFDKGHLTRRAGDQFSYRLKNDDALYANTIDAIPASAFNELFEGVEQQLIAMGNAIFAGDISVNPYRHANKTPCEYCDYASVCRIDRWTHEFRALTSEVNS